MIDFEICSADWTSHPHLRKCGKGCTWHSSPNKDTSKFPTFYFTRRSSFYILLFSCVDLFNLRKGGKGSTWEGSPSKVTGKLPKPIFYSSLQSLPNWAWRMSFWKCLLFCDRSSQGFEGHFVAGWLAGWGPGLTFFIRHSYFRRPLLARWPGDSVAWCDPKYRGYHWDASLGEQFIQTFLCFWIYLSSIYVSGSNWWPNL